MFVKKIWAVRRDLFARRLFLFVRVLSSTGVVPYFRKSEKTFSDTETSRPLTCPLSPHTGSYKTLPRAIFILKPLHCGLSLLLRLGIPYPDNSETSFSVPVFNPYQVSGPHRSSHSG
jgi:hypothetical protein